MFDSRGSLKGAMKFGTFVNVALLKGGIQGDCSLASSAPQNLAEGAEPNHCAIIARSNVTRSKQEAQRTKNSKRQLIMN
jgi:hypothetical protein